MLEMVLWNVKEGDHDDAGNRAGRAADYRPAASAPAGSPACALARHAPLRARTIAAVPVATRRYRSPADCPFPATGASVLIPVAGYCVAGWRVVYRQAATVAPVSTGRVAARCSVPARYAPLLRPAADSHLPLAHA